MGQLEIVFGYTKKIEALLQKKFGAEGRGLHTKLDGIERQLPLALVKRLRWIATIRNNLAHTEGFIVENITDFTKSCDSAIAEIEAINIQDSLLPGKPNANTRLTLEKIERRQVSSWKYPRSNGYSKTYPVRTNKRRGLRFFLPLLLGVGVIAWYVNIHEPSVFWNLNKFLGGIVKSKSSIQWSQPHADTQHMEGVKEGKARPSRRIKSATE